MNKPTNKNPLILVTGATGTVGSELVKQLIGAHQRVRVLVRDPAKASKFSTAVEVVKGDLAKPETLGAAFDGVDKAFVLSPPIADLEKLEANAFETAKRAGVKQIVNLSNFGAGSFGAWIWQLHGASEKKLRALGVAWTILRPTRFMSNTPYLWSSIKEQGAIFESTGDSKMTLIDPRDIAAVAVKVLTTPGHDGNVYELTGPEALSGAEIAQKIAAKIGKPVKFSDVPAEAAREAMLKSGLPELVVDAVLHYFTTVKEGRWYMTSTVAELLGRRAYTFDEWLHENAAELLLMKGSFTA